MAHRITRPATIAGALFIATAGLTACGSATKTSSSSALASATKVAATPTTAGQATKPSARGGRSVPVTLSEYAIKPAVASAPAGHITFEVKNVGRIKHQFTIIRTSRSAASVLSKQDPNDDIPGARGEIASIAPGASKKLVIKHLAAGHYAFVCALPGHYQAGMHTDFTVG